MWKYIKSTLPTIYIVFQLLVSIIRVAGDIDFVVERAKNLGWVGIVINFLVEMNPFVQIILILFCFLWVIIIFKQPQLFKKKKSMTYIFQWSNIRMAQNVLSINDIPMDISAVKSIVIEAEPLINDGHMSNDWDINVNTSAIKDGVYKIWTEKNFNKDPRGGNMPISTGPHFMELTLDENEGNRADVIARVTLTY